MTRALARQLIADLRGRPLQAAQLFLILAAAATALTFALSLTRTSSTLWAAFVSQTNGAQLSFLSRGANVDLAPIAQMEGVAQSAGPYPVLLGRILREDPFKHNMTMIGYALEKPGVDRPLVVAGRWLEPEATGEIVLDPNFAAEIGTAVGDEVQILQPGGHVSLQVVGLAVSPSWPYPLRATAPGHVLESTLPLIEPDESQWVSLLSLRLASPEDGAPFAQRVVADYPEEDINLIWDEAVNRDRVQFWDTFSATLLAVFSAFALLAVAVIVAYATSANVLAQYRELGLLKAVGFTPGQVTALLLVENLALGLLAGIAGVALGLALSPAIQPAELLRRYSPMFDTGLLSTFDPGLFLTALLGLLAIVVVATVVPAWQGGRIPTLRAITVGYGQPKAGPGRLAGWPLPRRLPAAIRMGVKSALSRPGRALLTLGGLALAVGVLTIALMIESTRQAYIEEPGLVGFPFDFILERNYLSHQEAEEILNAHPEILDYATLAYTSAFVEGTLIQLDVRAVGADFDRLNYIILEGSTISAPDEVMVGPGLLERTGLQIGDALALRTVEGLPIKLQIVGTFLDVEGTGQAGIVIGMDTYRQVYPDRQPVEYGLLLDPVANETNLRASLLSDSQGIFGLEVWGLATEMLQLRWPLVGLTLALAFIAVVNLFYTSQLAVQENFHDFGVLKAVGLTPMQVGISVTAGMALLAILATLIGVPFGLLVSQLLMSFLGELFSGGGALPYHLDWGWILLLLPVTVALAVLGSAIPAFRVAQLNVVDALRYE